MDWYGTTKARGLGLTLAIAAIPSCNSLSSPSGDDPKSLPHVRVSSSITPTVLEASGQRLLISFRGARGADSSITRTHDDAERLAHDVRTEALKPDADFEALVRKYSDAPDAKTGGRIGPWRLDSQQDSTTKLALLGAKPGQVTRVLTTAEGFVIVKRSSP